MDFNIDCSWGCPVCGEINHNRHSTNEGALDELWCDKCDATFFFTKRVKAEDVIKEINKQTTLMREYGKYPSIVVLGRLEVLTLKNYVEFRSVTTATVNQTEVCGLCLKESSASNLIKVI